MDSSRGGLCLAWKDNTNICLKSFLSYHIDVVLKENADEKECRFTGFYGSPYVQNRGATWGTLRNLNQL